MFKLLKRMMIAILIVVLLVAVAGFIFMQLPIFGKAPSGKRLEKLQQSPNYKDNKFQNIHFTPGLSEGYSMVGVFYDFLFNKHSRKSPTDTMPSVKTDLHKLDKDSNVLIWFGHSSYFMQVNGKRFLIDPVFSGSASPVPYNTTAFTGTDIYTADDFPEIDYLLISHDHYDHLDCKTVTALKSKVQNIICGLGVGEHLEYWGIDANKIIEKDWNESVAIDENMTIHTTSARHFSGRGFTRNNTLWLSFIIETPNLKIFLGGDSGYDTHFAEIGKKFGGFDLAILENGQYNVAWQAIHMLPEEVLKATKDLNAKRLFPVHSSKFALALHSWDEPLREITELNKHYSLPLVTPVIGQVVNLNDTAQAFSRWWEDVK